MTKSEMELRRSQADTEARSAEQAFEAAQQAFEKASARVDAARADLDRCTADLARADVDSPDFEAAAMQQHIAQARVAALETKCTEARAALDTASGIEKAAKVAVMEQQLLADDERIREAQRALEARAKEFAAGLVTDLEAFQRLLRGAGEVEATVRQWRGERHYSPTGCRIVDGGSPWQFFVANFQVKPNTVIEVLAAQFASLVQAAREQRDRPAAPAPVGARAFGGRS